MPRLLLLVVLLAACAAPVRPTPPLEVAPAVEDPLEQLALEGRALTPLMKSELGRAFVASASQLERPGPRSLFVDARGRVVTATKLEALPADERATFRAASPREQETFFYNTNHGTPLAYARAIDLLGQDGVPAGEGRRLADFGFGNVGQLRMLAQLGFSATGIDVNPQLGELYADAQGPYARGAVKVLIGRYPVEPALVGEVHDLDVFIAKNTLKKGYIHPDRPPGRPEWVIHLGVDDDTFLKTIHDALAPGGRFLIYNICPAPTPEGQPFVTWSDGRSPFTREQYARAGFKVKAFDVDDTEFVRTMGHLLRWDVGEDPFDLQHDLSVLYTLLERE
ncbi:MAG: class I SAM-dependent methyltransferase [Myxococcota bacterium]